MLRIPSVALCPWRSLAVKKPMRRFPDSSRSYEVGPRGSLNPFNSPFVFSVFSLSYSSSIAVQCLLSCSTALQNAGFEHASTAIAGVRRQTLTMRPCYAAALESAELFFCKSAAKACSLAVFVSTDCMNVARVELT